LCTLKERNAAGADAAAIECERIYELKYLGKGILHALMKQGGLK